MTRLTILAIVFLLTPALPADAAGALRRHAADGAHKARLREPAQVPPPPVTRLPIAPDTFRA